MEARRWREIAIEPPEDAIEAPFPVPEGMKAWKNRGNEFTVVACHYSADPKKRNDDWYSFASKGLRPDQIERELELNFNSRAGSKAFPYLEMSQTSYRKDPPHPIPSNWKIIAGLDWGARNPTGLVWFAIDTHRRFWAFDEFYKPMNQVHGGLPAFAEYIKKHPYFPRLRKIVADPKIFAKDQNMITKETGLKAFGTIKSIAELLMAEGVYQLERGNNDRAAGLQRLQQMFNFRGDGTTEPNAFIGKNCEKMWWEFTNSTYRLDDKENKNAEDDIVKKNDHIIDLTKYSYLSEDVPAEVVNSSPKRMFRMDVLEQEIEDRYAGENNDVFSVSMSELDGTSEFGEYN